MDFLLELVTIFDPIFIFFKNTFSYVGGIILLLIFVEKVRGHFSAKHHNSRHQNR
ncbi:MAG: hypothetical protein GQ581_09785 [Methyloprofundus sp.]|nr:hypothetical protein [Methyloprofundus sp.]